LGHVSSTKVDCASGAILRSTDTNGQSSFTQYDYLGRVVEIAKPGDLLTALPMTGTQAFTRDPDAPTGAGTTVGQARVTSWKEYLAYGSAGLQRDVVHIRDGSPAGLYNKSFFDGVGRTVQSRVKIDPAKSGNLGEMLLTTVYDGMGRTAATFAPCFVAIGDAQTPNCGKTISTTTYDALGRALITTLPGGRKVTNTYGQENGRWLETVVNPRGFTSKSYSNLLGQVV
jgi:YD repeat-containing protein